MIPWNPEFETGLAVIDAQHQGMFRAMGQLQEALESAQPLEQVQHVLRFLLLYCEIHMQEEELIFKNAGLPGAEGHAKEHRALIAQAYDLNFRWTQGEVGLVAELTRFLTEGLVNHIRESDLPLARAALEVPGSRAGEPRLMPSSWVAGQD